MANPPSKSHTSLLPEIFTQPGQLVLISFRRHLEKNTPTFKYKYFFLHKLYIKYYSLKLNCSISVWTVKKTNDWLKINLTF